jgi:glycine C-acetyltransferase
MSAKLQWIQDELKNLKDSGLYNRIRTLESSQGAWLVVDGKRTLNFCSNNYLGLANHPRLVEAAKESVDLYGVGPAAVRTIAGTMGLHVQLEERLAKFKGVEAAITYQSAFNANLGTIPALVGKGDVIFSDELNHASIIDGCRLSRAQIVRYAHCDPNDLERALNEHRANFSRAMVITDGVFSMRGDYAPLDEIMRLARHYDKNYAEGVLVVVDDSHGIGAFGETGRGTEEITRSGPADILIATLGKALGVNGGYVVAEAAIIDFLRETAPFYIYSNPITPGEAAAAITALDILEGPRGKALLSHLGAMTRRFEKGLEDLGLETIEGPHPVTPLMIRDTPRTQAVVDRLFESGVLATGLGYPVVPKGDEEIRFQICADHTAGDIDMALQAVREAVRSA